MNDQGNIVKLRSGDNSLQAFDVEKVRRDFPILSEMVYNKPLVFLDSGASAQKPKAVINAMDDVYRHYYANVHRGAHYLSQKATDAFENARVKVSNFINASSHDEVVFTKNTTEAINLVAQSWGRKFLKAGDEVLVSEMEHHANIVPWQLLEQQIGIKVKVTPINDAGELLMDEFSKLLTSSVKLVAITGCSNVLGTIVPVDQVIKLAHAKNIPVLIDGSQSVVHQDVDVQVLDCDFFIFTGHKLYGPTGVGVLYGKMDMLKTMPPYQGGGDMIETVSFDGTTFKEPPHRFEAGTPAIAEVIGLGAAIDYVNGLGMDRIAAHEQGLLAYTTEKLKQIEGLRILGNAKDKAGIFSFLVDGTHPFDVATILDRQGIAVRVGQHCAEPLMKRLGVDGTVRASMGLYNNTADVDALVSAIIKAKEMLI